MGGISVNEVRWQNSVDVSPLLAHGGFGQPSLVGSGN